MVSKGGTPMTFKHTTSHRWPLLPQMLWPLLVIEVMLLSTVVMWYWHESSSRIHREALGRAELIAQAIEQRAQSTSAIEALNRLAESFAANRDVEEVSVVETSSGAIRNSSIPALVGNSRTGHPHLPTRQHLSHVPPNHLEGVYAGHSFIYIASALFPTGNGGTASKFNILVRINVSQPWHMLWRDITAFALTGGLLVCATILLFYGMLYVHIYHPLLTIRNAMHNFTVGQRNIRLPAMRSSEFHNLAATLQTLLHGQTENELQLTNYTNKMEVMTAEMESARDEALRANLMKSDFLATMSHEIRTPMNGVIGMTDLLLESGLTGKQAHYARTVQQSAESLLSLIDDILDFSKIEAGKIDLEKTPFNLPDLMDGIGNILAAKARDKSLEMVLEVDTSLPAQFVGDPSRLRQVLLNLLGNAIKFTHHGYVMLSVHPAPGAPVGAAFSPGSPFPLVIQVKDTGVGIPPEMQKRVFEKFIQADSSTTRKYGGTGLGLAICQQLIQLMGGTITLESGVNAGTIFTINLSLPLGKQREAPATYPELAGKRILLIDDLPINLTVIQKQLQHLGLEVTTALNAKQALEHTEAATRRHQPFDLVLLDYLMPVQNGEQIATALRKLPHHADTPMVMMSASDGQGYQKRFAELGFSALLSKPLSLDTLAGTLSEALRHEGKPTHPIASLQPIAKGSYKGRRVLVADDNRSNREYIATLLEEMGFTVDEAVNGTEALTKVTSGDPYDLVLMDCEMPELDGRTATRNIRRKLSATDLPILALTGHTDARELDLCRAVGMNDCLAKPLRRTDLETALRTWLPLPAAHANPAQLVGRNILLVEDNRFNREFMTELLTTAGATVYTADNGKESLHALGRHPFIDAVLMDCQMPEMDGYEATEKIRQRQAAGEWPYMPIIALTANAMKGDREKCLAVGMDDYLSKPVNKHLLFATLAEWLTRASPQPTPNG
ncbi:MAG: response regulator, partial [Alphaproteobacteria bacterium]